MQQPRILLVDNVPVYGETIRRFLETERYDVLVATDPTEARRIMEHEPIDLAILDVRLMDEEDENDFSGIELAKKTDAAIPKIILTSYPTYKAVRDALGSTINGLPPAVGFVARQEGLEALLTAIRVALMPINPVLEKSLLRAFEAPARVELHHRIKEVGPEETGLRLRQTYDAAASELSEYRHRESKRASQLFVAGLISSGLGITFILAAGVLLLTGSIAGGVISLGASVVTNAIKALFSIREDAAHKRAVDYFKQLNDIDRIGNLMSLPETLESASDRDLYRKRVIDVILKEKWLGAAAGRKS